MTPLRVQDVSRSPCYAAQSVSRSSTELVYRWVSLMTYLFSNVHNKQSLLPNDACISLWAKALLYCKFIYNSRILT
jgi:hypothetical protein